MYVFISLKSGPFVLVSYCGMVCNPWHFIVEEIRCFGCRYKDKCCCRTILFHSSSFRWDFLPEKVSAIHVCLSCQPVPPPDMGAHQGVGGSSVVV